MATSILKNIKILIVDDSPHTLIKIKSFLISLGCEDVRGVGSAEEALDAISVFHPDLLICDWKMHPMDGIELVKQIRMAENSVNPFLPIIMTSGYPDNEIVKAAYNAGVDDFIPKPISQDILFEHIKSVLSNPKPYIRTPEYFGPDRRVHKEFFDGEDRRKMTTQTIVPLGKRLKV